MSSIKYYTPDPKTDLVLERIVDVPRELVWQAWTTPAHILKWFTPAPWKTIDCEIDLRPGGIFRTTMLSPEGQEFPNSGSFLEIVENERLVFTDILEPGFKPAASGGFFTAILTLEKHGNGTKYHVLARHKDEENKKKHEEMGFIDGWNAALNQLVELMKAVR
ncbi:SRPBCC family protein [Leptospira sarikeiensis]|uniref:Polyketide cyclase n=1 Tax=Leptospira sarikeiensis TaxID=2484943 RepID=A0A4R9KB64_9LEPT|nr:SRPBCC family protein [Leptospira sarikeiensis]TGL62053.1 polyketide cyclase [Leptospira sarikeiensis]